MTLPTSTDTPTTPKFDPTTGNAGDIPLPNDLLRDGNPSSPTYGFNTGVPGTGEPYASMRSIQGFSTTGNIIIPFDGGVDPASVNANSILVVDDATNTTVNCTYQVINPFISGQHTDSTILLSPVRALTPLHTYSVVLTSNLQGSGGAIQSTSLIELIKMTTPLVDGNGNSTTFELTNAQAVALEPLRIAYQPIFANAEAATGISRSTFVFAFQFGTQPEFFTLQSLRATAAASAVNITSPGFPPPTGAPPGTVAFGSVGPFNTTAFLYNNIFLPVALAAGDSAAVANATATAQAAATGGNYSVTFTSMNVPDYVGYTTGNATNGFFTGPAPEGIPVASKGTLPVPVLIILPTAADGQPLTTPVPCLIYQHGITRQKEDALLFAQSITSLGVGIIAIDLPLHGGLTEGAGITLAASTTNPQTGKPYASGDDFINLTSLRTSRDNFRQGATDLFYLTQAIVSSNVTIGANQAFAPGAPAYAPFLPIKPFYLGHSLGSLVGTVYTSVEANNKLAALSVPGGRVTQLLLNSPTFGPIILAGLSAAGVQPNTPQLTQFMWIAQTVFDDADPMNYATTTLNGALKGGSGSTVLIQEALSDMVIPNSATIDLANSMYGLSQVVATGEVVDPLLPQVAAPFVGSGLFQYPGAMHSFLLDPSQGNTVAGREQAYIFLFGQPQLSLTAGTIIIPDLPPATFPREAPGVDDASTYTGTVTF